MRHLGIDSGRRSVKTVTADFKNDIFPSDVGEYRIRKLQNELRPTDIILRTNFGSFFIGDLAKDESYGSARLMTPSKVHLDTKALIVAAIARLIEDGEEVAITTGVPVEFHTPIVKRKMADLISAGFYQVELNGTNKKFTITKVNVSVEGASAYMALCKGKGGVKRFIDIGSRTVNYGTVVNGRYLDRESGTLDYGCDTVNTSNTMFARKIAADLSMVWRDFSDETHVLGGGAILCSADLINYFPKLICASDPIFTTARAFQIIGANAQ